MRNVVTECMLEPRTTPEKSDRRCSWVEKVTECMLMPHCHRMYVIVGSTVVLLPSRLASSSSKASVVEERQHGHVQQFNALGVWLLVLQDTEARFGNGRSLGSRERNMGEGHSNSFGGTHL